MAGSITKSPIQGFPSTFYNVDFCIMLISEYDKNRLAVKTLQHEYTTNEYLINEQDENFKYIRSKFFALQSTKTTKTLNVGSGLFEAISDTYKYYV